MTGTPSRTATAIGWRDHTPFRHRAAPKAKPTVTPRGIVGRQLQAKLRSEEHESHMRHAHGGRGRVADQSPKSSGTGGCICGGYVERRSRALPREKLSVCLRSRAQEKAQGRALPESSRPTEGARQSAGSEYACKRTRTQAREAARLTMGRQKSAESSNRPRTAMKEEHMASNRNRAFDA